MQRHVPLYCLAPALLVCFACSGKPEPSTSPDDATPVESDASEPATASIYEDVGEDAVIDHDADRVEGAGIIATSETPPPPTEFHGRTAARVDLDIRQAEILGQLDAKVIERVVRTNLLEIQSCYEAGLDDQPTLMGTLTVEFEIDKRGEVSSSSTREGFDPEVGSCVAEAVADWSFPPPASGAVEVKVPIELRPA